MITKPLMLNETGLAIKQSLDNITEKLNNSGATAQQVAQIEKNKYDIANLQNDVDSLQLEADGIAISSAKINDSGNLIITLTNGTEIDAGCVIRDEDFSYELIEQKITDLSEEVLELQNRYSATLGKNIAQVESIVEGKFIYTNGTINANMDYFYTENTIKVEPNTTYVGSWWNADGSFHSAMTAFVLFYDSSDNFISGLQLNASANGVFTTPENCCYIRYSGELSIWNSLSLQIEKGDVRSSTYEECTTKAIILKNEHIPIDYIKNECNKKSYIYVDKNGNGDYTTVTRAVENARDGATIVVASGNYENEAIDAWGKEIHIVGTSRETCIISNSTATYSTPPIKIGKGSLENLTVVAKYGTGVSTDENGWLPYAVHTEDDNLYNSILTIRNCTFVSELNASFGLSMRGGCEVNIEHSHLIGKKGEDNSALFFQDSADERYTGEQNINIVNCIVESSSSTEPTFKVIDQCVNGNSINLTMINTLVYNVKGNNYRVGATNADGEVHKGWNKLMNTILTEKSFGNNIDVFNNNQYSNQTIIIDSGITSVLETSRAIATDNQATTTESGIVITETAYEKGEL